MSACPCHSSAPSRIGNEPILLAYGPARVFGLAGAKRLGNGLGAVAAPATPRSTYAADPVALVDQQTRVREAQQRSFEAAESTRLAAERERAIQLAREAVERSASAQADILRVGAWGGQRILSTVGVVAALSVVAVAFTRVASGGRVERRSKRRKSKKSRRGSRARSRSVKKSSRRSFVWSPR